MCISARDNSVKQHGSVQNVRPCTKQELVAEVGEAMRAVRARMGVPVSEG